LRKIKFEKKFSISKNNIISAEATKGAIVLIGAIDWQWPVHLYFV
jgi:hypothetical protein